ncbi:MFS transporter [Caldimonas sp. KR1-144]|uniref:MFS transporter n=1 Tax=Caldimonas sp. KR1-144 TaxID=3400911 RepID=UPI003C0E28EF
MSATPAPEVHAPDSLEALKARHGARFRWLVVLTVMIGTVASILASTIVNVAVPALGPSVGGVLVEHFGWRSIFFFVLPFCALAALLARRYLPHARPGGGTPGGSDVALDLPGLAMLAVLILALLNGLVHLHGQAPVQGLALLGVALVALVAFVLRQRRAAHPLLAPALFRERGFAMGAIVAFIYGMGLFGSTYLVPVFMQNALHFRPTEAGAALLPAGLLPAASFALMAGVAPDTALWALVTIAIVGRIGLGLILPSLNLAAVRRTEPALLPQAASAINFLRQLGGAVGVSAVGIVLEWRLRAHAADSSHVAFAQTFWMIAAVCGLAAIAAWRMGDTRVR